MWNLLYNRFCRQTGHIYVVGLILLSALFGCSKPRGDYYKYVNNVHIYDGNALQFLQSQQGIYDSLLFVLSRLPDIQDSVMSDSITLLAPTNQSFQTAIQNLNVIRKVQNKPLLYLSTVDSAQLDTLVSRYILRSRITTDEVIPYVDGISAFGIKYGIEMNLQYEKTSAEGANLSGPQLLYVSDTKTSPFIQYWVRTTTASVNLHTNNAIIHTLVAGHEFGFGEFSTRLNK